MNTATRPVRIIRSLALLTAVSATAALARPVLADFTWDGGAVDDLWASDDNWVGDVAPGADLSGMQIVFGPTGVMQTPDAGAIDWTNIGGIAFTGADAELRIIGTGSLSFNDGATIINDSAFTQTIDVDLIATGDAIIFEAMSAALNIDGDVDLSAGDGVLLTVQGDETTSIGGVISGDGASILKQGDGLLLLAAANTFDGGVEITGGGLVLGNDDALGTGSLTVNGDASVESTADDRSIDNRIFINDVELTVTGSNDIEFTGRMSGTGLLTIDMDDDMSTVRLGTRNIHEGGTDLRRGTVELGDNRAFGRGDVTVKGDVTITSDDNSRQVNNNIEIRSTRTLTFSGSNHLRLRGIISGLGQLVIDADGNNDRLILEGNNTYEGGTVLNRGTLLLQNNNALGTGDLRLTGDGAMRSNSDFRTIDNRIRLEDNTLAIRGTSNLTLSGKISGTGGLLIDFSEDDVRLRLSFDNTYSGLTDVMSGILQLDGAVGGDLTVREDGTLISSGTIGGDLLVEDGGIVQPGSGLETLTVDGNFTLADGATYELEIDVNEPEFDIIDVGGTATLADGSMIEASVSGNAFVVGGTMFNVLTADGGITDNGVEVMTESATLSFELIPDPDFTDGDMTFALVVLRSDTAYSDAADAGNNAAIGGALDAIVPVAETDPDGEVGILLGRLDALDEDAFNEALTELSPEPYNAAMRLGVETARVYSLELSRYLSARRTGLAALRDQNRLIMPRPGALAMSNNDPAILASAIAQMDAAEADMDDDSLVDDSRPYSVFGQFHGSFIDQDSSGNRTGFDGEVFGGQGGIDWQINDNTVAGISFGYSHAEGDWNSNIGSIQVDSVRGGPYLGWSRGPAFIDASLSIGYHMYHSDRDLLSLGINPESDFDAFDITAYIRGGYDFEIATNVFLTPNASVQYSWFSFEDYSEDNAGGAGFRIDERDESSLRTRLGVELSAKFDAGVVIVPSVFGGWEREWAGDTDDIDARFIAGGAPFSVDTGPRDEDSFYLGAGINILFHPDVSGFLRVERSFGDDADIDGVAGGLTFQF